MSLSRIEFQNFFFPSNVSKDSVNTVYYIKEFESDYDVIFNDIIIELKKLKLFPNSIIKSVLYLRKKDNDYFINFHPLKELFKKSSGFLIFNKKDEIILCATNKETIKEGGIEQYFIKLKLN